MHADRVRRPPQGACPTLKWMHACLPPGVRANPCSRVFAVWLAGLHRAQGAAPQQQHPWQSEGSAGPGNPPGVLHVGVHLCVHVRMLCIYICIYICQGGVCSSRLLGDGQGQAPCLASPRPHLQGAWCGTPGQWLTVRLACMLVRARLAPLHVGAVPADQRIDLPRGPRGPHTPPDAQRQQQPPARSGRPPTFPPHPARVSHR